MKLVKTIALSLLMSASVSAAWNVDTSHDEMTGESSSIMMSDTARPTRNMEFPYSDVYSAISVIKDDKENERATLHFNKLNIRGGDIFNGFTSHSFLVKFGDNKPVKMKGMIQNGGKSIHITRADATKFIAEIQKVDSILVQLKWYGEGNVNFKYDVKDAQAAYNKL